MGLINDTVNKVGLGSLTTANVNAPQSFGPDFPEGFIVEEYSEGTIINTLTFAGPWMPKQPFKFGGTQEIKKEYYAGNSEPTVQVLGSREDNIQITGRLYLKRLKDQSLRTEFTNAAEEMEKQVDDMRKRGNLVKIKLRDWFRYAFIESAKFDMKKKIDIDYVIDFIVIGTDVPLNSMFLEKGDDNTALPSKQLASRASELFVAMKLYPSTMPRTISEQLDSLISGVSSAVNLVTSFVDGIVQDAESIVASANRAIGIIQHARATVSATSRKIGQISTDAANLGQNFSTSWEKAAATIRNVNHLHTIQDSNVTLGLLLADLMKKFKNIAAQIPFQRHLVRSGDTLQTISMKYYNTSENWDKIMSANKLTTTQLVIGTILEIPRI